MNVIVKYVTGDNIRENLMLGGSEAGRKEGGKNNEIDRVLWS